MRTFVVNLEQSTERKLFMKQQLETLNMTYEFFPAVDGRKLSNNELEKMCNMKVVRAWADLLTPGMIGCSLSHYNVYKKMVKENIELAFVLEDDTHLSSRVPTVLSEIEQKIKTGEIDKEEPILLYYQSKETVNFTPEGKVLLTADTGLYHPIDIWRPITTAAYVISLSCAKRLVDLIYPIRYSPDSWAVFHRENAIAGLRCVLPLPVESGFFKSDIGYEENKILNRLVKMLEENNVFPVKQLLKWRRRIRSKRQNQFLLSQEPLNWRKKELV
jgi:glycosyl transferase, family 25